MILKKPFKEYIPKFFRRDDKLNALADKADQNIQEWEDDIKGIEAFRDPVRIPAGFLVEQGIHLNAGINNTDSERTKRKKVATAVKGHKLRGTWSADAKPKIDAIAGGDSKIIQVVGSDDFIVVGDSSVPQSYFWSVVGGDAASDDYGIRLVGVGNEDVLKGIISIDVDNDSLTAEEVEQIKMDLEDVVPAYFIVFLGYVNGSGVFIRYPNGQIG